MNTDTKQMRGGCGGNCACARAEEAKKEEASACVPKGTVVLDAEGKCPCGKSLDECCHKDELKANQNDAVGELCDPASGKNLC